MKIMPPIRRVAKTLYNNTLGLLGFWWKSKFAPPCFVYQMGKVGSTSVYRALRKHYPGPVIHGHNLLRDHGDILIRRLFQWAIVERKPVNVISFSREPIGQSVSAFFENFAELTGVHYEDAKFTIDELREIFLQKYPHETPLSWFDDHILKDFGIDVYATPFPAEGFALYARENARLLVMHAELSDTIKAKQIAAFLDLSPFGIQRRNVGEEKAYAKTYKAFKSEVKFPPDYIDRMCTSKYFSYFYENEYIERVRRQWEATS